MKCPICGRDVTIHGELKCIIALMNLIKQRDRRIADLERLVNALVNAATRPNE